MTDPGPLGRLLRLAPATTPGGGVDPVPLLAALARAAAALARLDPRARAMLDQALACSVVGAPGTVRRGLRELVGPPGPGRAIRAPGAPMVSAPG